MNNDVVMTGRNVCVCVCVCVGRGGCVNMCVNSVLAVAWGKNSSCLRLNDADRARTPQPTASAPRGGGGGGRRRAAAAMSCSPHRRSGLGMDPRA